MSNTEDSRRGTSSDDFTGPFEFRLNRELQKELDGASSHSPLENEEQFLLPSAGMPGVASESLLVRGLQVPSRTRMVSSGFQFPEQLSSYSVTETQWTDFTSKITSAAKMSSDQWKTAIAGGIGTLVVGGMMIGFLSPIPAYVVTKKIKRTQEEDNLKNALTEGSGELQQVINEWNETFFRPRNLLVRVDLPGDADDILMGYMDVSGEMKSNPLSSIGSSGRRRLPGRGGSNRGSSESSRIGSSRGGSSLSTKEDDTSAISSQGPTTAETYESTKHTRLKASRRGRIVILPFEESGSRRPESIQG